MTSNKEFTSHLRSHNEVKPTADPADPTGQAKVYNCCLCGKMLSSFSSLDRHMLVHSGERPFSCEVCGQTFTTNGNMHRHRRTHNLRDSCESDGSGGSASKKMRKRKAPSALMSPIDKVTIKSNDRDMPFPPLKCPICPEHFYSENFLEIHILSVHPGKEIRCEDCSHPCPSYNYFKLHRNMFHYKPSAAAVAGFPGSAPLLTSAHPLLATVGHQPDSVKPAAVSPLLLPAPIISPVKRDNDLDSIVSATATQPASVCDTQTDILRTLHAKRSCASVRSEIGMTSDCSDGKTVGEPSAVTTARRPASPNGLWLSESLVSRCRAPGVEAASNSASTPASEMALKETHRASS